MSRTAKNSQRVAVVIEDDQVTRDLLATLLQEEGFKAVTVADGDQALQVILRLKPDVVTLDLSLPGKGGAEILAELWHLNMHKRVPVIVVSATAAHLPLSIRAMAHSIVDKPFNLNDLLRAVEKATNEGNKKASLKLSKHPA